MFPRLKRKQRVLLLDDDPSMQCLVSALIKREGYRVDVFLSGCDAMRAIDRDKYDVLIRSAKGEVAGVVTKPFQSADLIDAVRNLGKVS
jgi:PleD family two-component response regulator